ncbi:type I methionyl aminopeptidase [Catenuloplanes sp. NPDC051500]|uniref:type I methionyl aminopeptidase n=1 Tax=Catenuloplanes sp. NPDC051500 TaxID=3363959 RepID=UPI0037BAB457
MIALKSPSEIAALREAGRVVANALAAVRAHAAVGVSLLELDRIAATVIADAGAVPSFLHYQPRSARTPYPAVICASINDAVVHGIPTDYRLADGDLVSIDAGAHLDGWCGDSAISFTVGTPRPADLALIAATDRALAAGIAAARPGARIGDVADAIGTVARLEGYGIMADHGGHGVGRAMHEDPSVPNEGRPGRGIALEPGLVIAIEPMLIASGRDDYRTDRDGWTLRTRDGSRAAHAEHTIAVTASGPLILTAA